jgi:hypothetical protein
VTGAPFNPAGQPAMQQPGAGGQPGMHATVPYGLPGAPPATVLPPNPQGGGWNQQPAQPAPQWGQPGAPQPGAAQQPPQSAFPVPSAPATFQGPPGQPPVFGGQPAQQQPPQPQPARYDIPDHVVLDGPGIPPEIRGRTFGQMKQIYGALASDFVSRQPGRPAAAQAQPQPGVGGPVPSGPPRGPQGQPIYVQGQPNGGQPQPQDEVRQFWENPAGFIRQAVRDETAQVMGPVAQRNQAQAIQEARAIAASGIPDFAALEGEMMGMLTQAPQDALADPRLWISTADLVRGRLMAAGRYDPRWQNRQPAPQQNGAPQFGGQNFHQQGPGVSVPAPMAPIPHQSFFTEAPTAPPANYGGWSNQGNQWQLSPDQQAYAQKMGMTEQQYRDWSGGVSPTATARRW